MLDDIAINHNTLQKSLTGITGLDEITYGGLPTGRPTLVYGAAGSGKTLFGVEFLVRGITQFDEPGVFIAFEETRKELTQNVASLGFSLDDLVEQNKLVIDYVSVDRSDFEQTGEYDLDGLFVRLDYAIQKVKAKRIVLDTIEVLFSALGDSFILRAELRRLFRWLKDKELTAVITGERGDNLLTRHGIEEYVSDCVIMLDHRVDNQMSTRRLRIIKYRGSRHETNEYPFLIDESGFSVLPITSVGLEYYVSEEYVSSGISRLDSMLNGTGFFRGSTVLVSGPSGTGKTTIAAQFVDAACRRNERSLFFSFEESPLQIIRNMNSVGLDLQKWVQSGLLRFSSSRPTVRSFENHLTLLHREIQSFDPQVVVIDPISNFNVIGTVDDSRALLTRLIDFLKLKNITALFTSLTNSAEALEQSETNISSMVDAWLLVKNVEANGERNRVFYILKARGIAHSNQVTEFQITQHGIELVDTYLGSSGVLTGSARLAQELKEQDEESVHHQAVELRQLQIDRKRTAIMAQIEALRAELAVEQAESQLLVDQESLRADAFKRYTEAVARKRQVASDTHKSEVPKNNE